MNPQFFQPAPAKPSPNPTPLQPSQPLTNQSATNQPAQVAQTQPATMISRSDAETENHKKAADIARSEIDRILIGDDGSLRAADSELADEPTSGTMITPVASRIQPDVNPYNQTHSPTSDTANLHSDDQPAASASVLAQRQAYIAAHQKYHAAWQRYYQQYYERYYLAALENEKRKFQNQTASVKTGDGTLSQKEAVDELRAGLLGKIQSAGKKVKKSRHFWPAVAALCVILVAAFIQYNQLLFANISSFVSPGKISSDNIVIGTAGSDTVSADPLVIIPKINVQAPVIYGLPNLNEDTALNALKSGVIHYPLQGATAYPGQNGNSVFLGHSSSDIFNNGKYKFIFVQLDRLTTGDLFYINYNSVQYTYKVTKTEVVAPTDVGALALGTDKPRASLITCDPPGTARNRLIVIGDQINPDPGKAASTQKADDSGSTNKITGTPPTLFEKIFGG